MPPAVATHPLLPASTLPPDAQGVLEAADGMRAEALDAVPYGLIQLDATGRILAYNATEARLASVPQATALGKAFFTEVAPCCKVPAFHGRFALVRLWYARRSRTVWVLVVDESPPPAAG